MPYVDNIHLAVPSYKLYLLELGNNPRAGASVPQAFMDVNLNTIPDTKAVSG
jgi:hypothetical protein